MSKEKKTSGGLIVVATAIGAVLGAAAGIILAPQSGKKTQEKLQEVYTKTAENITSIASTISDKANEVLPKAVAEVKEMPGQIKEGVEKIADDTKEAYNKVKEKTEGYVSDTKKTVTTSIEEGKKKFKEVSKKG